MQSNVGNPQIYEASDQRTSKSTGKPSELIYEEGQKNAHLLNDPSGLNPVVVERGSC